MTFRNVSKVYRRGPGEVRVLAGFRLAVERGEFVTVIGPSGCGKTTLLRLAAGLERPDAGDVELFGRPVSEAVAAKQIGYVPQSPALLPWRTVLDNVMLPLQVNRRRTPVNRPDPEQLLEVLGLGHAADRMPHELSGGMQQRVAIARAFIFDPPVLLMDEPFAAVDELTREALRHELLTAWQQSEKTVLFVTHSVAEAIALSDRVVVMSGTTHGIQNVLDVPLSRPRDDLVETTRQFQDLERELRLELRSGMPAARPR